MMLISTIWMEQAIQSLYFKTYFFSKKTGDPLVSWVLTHTEI